MIDKEKIKKFCTPTEKSAKKDVNIYGGADVIAEIQAFLNKYGLTDCYVRTKSRYEYGSEYDILELSANVPKTDEELENDIALAEKATAAQNDQDYQTYLELQKKFAPAASPP